MRTIVTTVVIIIIIAGCASDALSPNDTKEITNTFMSTKDAWNKGDLVKFMEGYNKSEDIAFVGAGGPIYGYDATLKRYQGNYPDTIAMGRLDFDILKLNRIDRNTALMIGKFHLTRTIGNMEGYYTLVWQKINGKWVIISDHSSSSSN